MTDVAPSAQHAPSIAAKLRTARERTGLTIPQAAGAASLIPSYLASLEDGRRRPLPAEVDRLSRAYGADLSDLLPARRAVEIDVVTGEMGIDGETRRVRDLTDDHQVYATYLFLLCAVRGAQPGESIALRSSDVELLVSVLGEDPDTVEQRLVRLMGCTVPEASLLRRVLLRHRPVTAR